jgi:hypothetical protein
MSVLQDTSALSELLRARPDAAVLAWFALHPADGLFVSAVTQAEIMLGACLLPAGQRKDLLARQTTGSLQQQRMSPSPPEGNLLPTAPFAAPRSVESSSTAMRKIPVADAFDSQFLATLWNGQRIDLGGGLTAYFDKEYQVVRVQTSEDSLNFWLSRDHSSVIKVDLTGAKPTAASVQAAVDSGLVQPRVLERLGF